MRRIYLLLLLVVLSLPACRETGTVDAADFPENVKLARRVFDHFNRHEWDQMATLYAPRVQFKDPSLGPGVVTQTRAEVAAKYREMEKMFPDIRDKVVSVYPSGLSHVVVEFVSTGTGPDGKKFELPICTIFTIEDGLITKDFTYYDNSQGG